MRGLSPGAAGLLLAAVALGLAPLEAHGQEQQARPRGCTLVLEPTPSTQSIRRRVGPDQYITHLWGGMRWTCGTARMVADSAVKYDRTERLVMIGSVDYQDSVRTLTSDTLTYFEGEDRIVAEGRVRLTRTATGSTLEGPHVVFFRSRGGQVERTVARERPHMVLQQQGGAAGEGDSPPVVLDADSAVFVGEARVRTWGDVRIERPGRPTKGRADSASFWTDEGRAELYGSPRVTGEAFRLTGRLVRLGLEEGTLRSVEAVERGRATGEEFDLFGDRIRARMAEEELDRLWAYGEGRSVALSPPYRLAADSLDFAFRAGELDTVTSVGEATAVEVGAEPPEDPMEDVALTVGERNWVTGDTLYVAFGAVPSDTADPEDPGARPAEVADTAAAPPDTAADSAGAAPPERRIRSMRAVGHARAYYLVQPDSARGAGAEASGTEGGRRGRTYQIGREIVVHFERGEASRVRSREAIGVYLDPIAAPAAEADTASDGPEPGGTAPDSVPAPAPDTSGDPP